MKTYKLLLVIVILLSMYSCMLRSTVTTFDNFGILFTCPSGWEVTKIDDDEGLQMVSIEKSGVNSSGLIKIIICSNETLEAEDLMDSYQESLQEMKLFSDMKMSEVANANYGKYNGLFCSYTAKVMKLPHQGRVYVFSSGDILISLVEQEAVEDNKINHKGFEAIKESFIIKKNIATE